MASGPARGTRATPVGPTLFMGEGKHLAGNLAVNGCANTVTIVNNRLIEMNKRRENFLNFIIPNSF